MEQYTIVHRHFVQPTPAGAYHAVASPIRNPAQALIQSLLSLETLPRLTQEALREWTGLEDAEQALALLYQVQERGWVQGFRDPRQCPQGPLELLLPELLPALGSQAKVLLADSQGFFLGAAGFPHEVCEELSALSADIASLHERRSGLLLRNMGLNSSAWSVVDAGGSSRLGFWPLYIGPWRFVLAVAGMPRFNRPEFLSLAWILSRRYGDFDTSGISPTDVTGISN